MLAAERLPKHIVVSEGAAHAELCARYVDKSDVALDKEKERAERAYVCVCG